MTAETTRLFLIFLLSSSCSPATSHRLQIRESNTPSYRCSATDRQVGGHGSTIQTHLPFPETISFCSALAAPMQTLSVPLPYGDICPFPAGHSAPTQNQPHPFKSSALPFFAFCFFSYTEVSLIKP